MEKEETTPMTLKPEMLVNLFFLVVIESLSGVLANMHGRKSLLS